MIDFSESLKDVPKKYLQNMTDEEFYLAMFYDIWPDAEEE